MKVLASVARVCCDLFQTTFQKEALPAAAWNARNMLALWVWIGYCSASQENSKRIHEEALRDALGLPDPLSEMSKLSGTENEFGESARKKIVDVAREKLGTESLDANFERVAAAAKQVDMDKIFRPHNIQLSKFAHPTAFLVIGT